MSKKITDAAAPDAGAAAPSDAPNAADKQAEGQAQDQHPETAYVRELLVRNGLKHAYLLPSGPCFDEAHARHVAGDDFDTLTVISAE